MLALSVLLVALATPAPAPKPTATNPFTLAPIPSTPLPVIGTTRTRAVCTALRQAVAPAIQAAMKNDQTYTVLRKTIFDYVVKDGDTARDLRLVQMDRQVDAMVKNVDALQAALRAPALENPKAPPEEAKTLRELREGLSGILAAQKVQLDAMSGFVETERMRRFGTPDESMRKMQATLANPGMTGPTPSPVTGFLRDAGTAVLPQHETVTTLADAHKLDRDLGDIAATTSVREQQATPVIVAASNGCK